MKLRTILAIAALAVAFNGALAAFVFTAAPSAESAAQPIELREGLERLAVSDIKGNGAF